MYSPVEVLSEHRAIWAKWWQEGTDPKPIDIGSVPLGATMRPTLLRGWLVASNNAHLATMNFIPDISKASRTKLLPA